MIALFFLSVCISKVVNGVITYQDISGRVSVMEYGDPSNPPNLPTFINDAVSMVLVANVRGSIREVDAQNGGYAIYGTWNQVYGPTLAIIAFLTGNVLPQPATVASTPLKYALWFSEECMDRLNTSECSAPYAMNKFHDVLWGNTLQGQNFPASKATMGAVTYNVEAAQLASLKQIPQVGWMASDALLSNKVDFPTYMRTKPAASGQARGIALYLAKLNAYTRIDTVSCDTVGERAQVAEFTDIFRQEGITSYVAFWKPRRYTALPPDLMATCCDGTYADGAVEEITAWGNSLAGLKANNAHAHNFMITGGSSCPAYDILSYLSMHGLVGAGHLWFGDEMQVSGYEGVYLRAVRYNIPPRIGFISPYAFQPAFDGYLQVKPVSSPRMVDFYSWLETLENKRTTLFEPWLNSVTPANVFANASTSQNIFWGPTYIGFNFDAMWTYLLAINSIVHRTGSSDFTPEELLTEAKKQNFEGLTGTVRYNQTTGDRIADYLFIQYQGSSVVMPRQDCATNASTGQFDASLIASQCDFPPLNGLASEHHLATFGETLVMTSKTPVFFGGSTEPPPDFNKLCQPGESYNIVNGTCDKCALGRYNDKPGQASCDPCRAGNFADTIGSPYCTGCLVGTIAAEAGASSCTNCTAGTYAGLAASSTCQNCTAGRYAEIGFDDCLLCQKGRYQDERGQKNCKLCGDVFPGTTSDGAAISGSECFCNEDTYYRPGIGCESCGKGMDCLKGGDIPRQREGFYVEVLETGTRNYDVFECVSTNWCPAGELGTCSDARSGRSCALVVAKKCPPWVGTLLPISMIIVMYLVYRVTSNAKYGKVSGTVMLVGNLGIALSAMQAVNVYVLLYDEVPKELEWLLRMAEVFMFKWQGFFPECNIGSSFSARLSLSMVPPLAIVGAAGFNLGITKLLRETWHHCGTFGRQIETFVPHISYGCTWNCVGIVLQVMYILQCKDAFSYFSSKSNPCDKKTLTDYSDVIFWSSDHTSAGAILITMYLWSFYVIGSYALLVYTVVIAKSKIGNTLFWQKWRFIFSRWRPECRHWGCIILARNLCIALVPIAVPTEQLYRVFAFVFILGVHAVFEAYYCPWLSDMNNVFEIFISMVLCGMGVVGLGFHEWATDHQKTVASFVMVILMAAVWSSLFLSVAYALLWASPKRLKIRHERHEKSGSSLLEKAGGILELVHREEDVKKRWVSYTKSCSAYDRQLCDGALKFLLFFEKEDPLRRRMQSRFSAWTKTDTEGGEKVALKTQTSGFSVKMSTTFSQDCRDKFGYEGTVKDDTTFLNSKMEGVAPGLAPGKNGTPIGTPRDDEQTV